MPAYAFPNKRSYDKMARVVRLREGLEGGRGPQRIYPRDNTPRLGKVTTADIAAMGTGEVTVQKPDWTDTTTVLDGVANDTDREWAVGDRVYIMRIAGKWRIIGPLHLGTQTITFTITSADGTDTFADVGFSTPGSIVGVGDSVELTDPMGCMLNETPDDLVGRTGFAIYMGSGNWGVTSMCCPPEA